MKLSYLCFRAFDRISPAESVYAHCDIPCGIYDPISSQLAAMTVVRMVQLFGELKMGDKPTLEERNTYVQKVSRFTRTKEQHAEKVETEIVTLWADYFKPEHKEKFPDLHELVWKTLKATGAARQNVDLKAAQDLLEHVNKIADIFWQTKGYKTKKVKAANPSGCEIIVPVY